MTHVLRVLGIVAVAGCVGDERSTGATHAAITQIHDVTVNANGTFTPNYLQVQVGDSIRWHGLGRTDAVVRIDPTADPTDACSSRGRAFDPDDIDGPVRRGLSGIWALGPDGTSASLIEIPSAEADAIVAGITAGDGCEALDHERDIVDPGDPAVVLKVMKYEYTLESFHAGDGEIDGSETDLVGNAHLLCVAKVKECNAEGRQCHLVPRDPSDPSTVAPGTYLHGLLSSTYANPDVTGVILRINWNAIQYDDGGTIRERWGHLDRELERAIAHGKLVTLEVRAGMYGTPDWIFTDYLDHASTHAAFWCKAPGCSFASAPPSAGQVTPLEFVDFYDSPQGTGCGNPIRIGDIGDPDYRNLYRDFMARLAAHIASDTRWFQAVAHVKVSGANLQTGEAELPHHCLDEYVNTSKHYADPKGSFPLESGDRVLDVFKTQTGDTYTTEECVCNTKIWHEAGYTPEKLYNYFAAIEHEILVGFFGRKSLAYTILQDGFPRANAKVGGGYWGDHLYKERLTMSSTLVNPEEPTSVRVNEAYEDGAVCKSPTVDTDGHPCATEIGGAVVYCSSDVTSSVYDEVTSTWIDLHTPLALDPVEGGGALDEDDTGARYPRGSEQSETILDQGARGRFGVPALPSYQNAFLGRLFVSQHDGLQPLPLEQKKLHFTDIPHPYVCEQQRQSVAVLALDNDLAALFPIPPGHDVSTLRDASGCPNRWIVNEGKDSRDTTMLLGTPPVAITHPTPPQITGFQTTNRVRTVEHVESTLFNLVYNTNGVFIELYEDAIWRIGITRGTGATALPLNASGRGPGCSLSFCYSKNLSRWAEELHWRRELATAMWGVYDGIPYPQYGEPFPDEHTVTVGTAGTIYYVNPSRCSAAQIDDSGNPNAASALGVIEVMP